MKKAFTLLEIIFVIVILGILSGVAVFYFRTSDSELVQAKNQLINHIRYTQHLALMDDRFDPNGDRWYGERWQMRFYRTQDSYYVIFSNQNSDGGQPDRVNEIAIDPYEKVRLGVGNSDPIEKKKESITYLSEKYNTSVSIECINPSASYPDNSLSIIFDTIGRPYITTSLYSSNNVRAYEGLMRDTCTITLTHNETRETDKITIHPETGFVE